MERASLATHHCALLQTALVCIDCMRLPLKPEQHSKALHSQSMKPMLPEQLPPLIYYDVPHFASISPRS